MPLAAQTGQTYLAQVPEYFRGRVQVGREGSPYLPSPPLAKAKECLYPDGDALLLAGRSVAVGKLGPLGDVPLLRRLAYGFLAREGMCTNETASLRRRDASASAHTT